MKNTHTTESPEVVALSVQQPAASLIAAGAKTTEYRTWQTRYRGPLLIVASKQPKVKGLPFGQAVCVVDLVDCKRENDGIFGWELEGARPIEPFDVKGRLGLYKVSVSSSLLADEASAHGKLRTNNKVLTFGYQGHKPEDLLAECRRLGAMLLDIRYAPCSRRPEWQRKNLQTLFGSDYLHVPQLGNIHYKDGLPMEIADMDAGIGIVLEHLQNRAVVLMCVCKDFQHCHRRLVAEELEERGVGVSDFALHTDNEADNLKLF